MYLHHPYWWSIVERFWSASFLPDGAQEWLHRLVKAWAEGMTLGYEVSITRPSRRAGRSATLFSSLYDTDGWLASKAALADASVATRFIYVYYELHEGLKGVAQWKSYSRDFREDPDYVVDEMVPIARRVLEAVKKDRHLAGETPSEATLKDIVRTGFNEVYKGRSPRDEIACQLLATLPWSQPDGTVRRLDASQVRKALERLRKYHKHFVKTDTFKDIQGIVRASLRRQQLHRPERSNLHLPAKS